MNKPKMILFDYGNTIITEKILGFDKGNEALLKLAVKNPLNITIKELQAKADEVIKGIPVRMGYENNFRQPYEINWVNIARYIYEYFNIEFDMSYEELEWIYWNNVKSARPSDNIEDLLEYLYENDIKTGVVSNIMLSGNSLKRNIKKLLPNNHFEFVIASSDYIYRKPEKEIFEMALIKSGFHADEVWFCGDNPICDIEGASNAGIQPVWYKKTFKEKSALKMTLQNGYIEINDWLELKDIVEGCN